MRPVPFALALGCLALPCAWQAAPAQSTDMSHGHGLTIKIKTSSGQDAGTATFSETKSDELHIELRLKNLPPGEHGVHIHEKALCEQPDFKTAGGHFNPANKQHGYLNPGGHHNGDLPENVVIQADGTGSANFNIADMSVATGSKVSILSNGGTSIMIHAKPDDMKTDPSGNSGARIACGVIQVQTNRSVQ